VSMILIFMKKVSYADIILCFFWLYSLHLLKYLMKKVKQWNSGLKW
jgi:hypothetical protein